MQGSKGVSKQTAGKYYAVKRGYQVGVFTNWDDCKRQVNGYSGAVFKSFKTREEAIQFVGGGASQDNTTIPYERDARQHAHARASSQPAPPPRLEQGPELPKGLLPLPCKLHIDPYSFYRIDFDGASRGNPGRAGCGAVIVKLPEQIVVCNVVWPLGPGPTTNNVAEYSGLLIGLKLAAQLGIKKVKVRGDSKLVICQVDGSWKINKEHLFALHEQVMVLKHNFQIFQAEHVLREFNTLADELSNQAIDQANLGLRVFQ